MKAMVTGGAGFIGSHIVDALIEAGHDVCVVDNLWNRGGGRMGNINKAAKFYLMDVQSPLLRQVFDLERPDIVYHEAAQHSVKISTDYPVLDAQVNTFGLLNVLRCCVRMRTQKIVLASSGATHGPIEKMPIVESAPQLPSCPYGITKMTAEHYLRYWNQQYGLKYTIFRYPNVYGPRQDATGEAGVIAIFARRILEGEKVQINWGGEQTRDFVYVVDIARANLLVASSGDNETYCLGSGIGTSVNEIYRLLTESIGISPGTKPGVKTPGDQRHSRFDASKARRDLGWAPQVSLKEGLKKTVEFFKERV